MFDAHNAVCLDDVRVEERLEPGRDGVEPALLEDAADVGLRVMLSDPRGVART